MAIPRLTTKNCALVVIDIQERLWAQMLDPDRLIRRNRFLLQIAGTLGLPTLVTEQYVKGLGLTVETLREVIPEGSPIVEKTRFSGCVDEVWAWLEREARPHVLLAGIEAHVCVMQTALDLLARGAVVFLVTDAISAGEPDQIEPAIRRMERAGAWVTGSVSVTYELLADAADPRFKQCLTHIKAIRSD